MPNIDFEKRAVYAIRSAIDVGSDAHQTTPVKEVENNLESHIDTELDIIWEKEGEKPEEEWDQIRTKIIRYIPKSLEKIQQETDWDFHDDRVLRQFEELSSNSD
jgi:hypothetical protein